MRIGIVTEYYYPTLGGIQEHVHHFARQARRAGHDVRILTPEVRDGLASVNRDAASTRARRRADDEMASSASGSRSRCCRADRSPECRAAPRLSARIREIIRGENFDVVHATRPLMPTLPLLALRSLRGGQRRHLPQRVRSQPALRPLARALAALRRLAATRRSASPRRRWRGSRRYFRAPWHVIPNGVDVAAFSSGRRRPEFDDGRLNLLHVGRFDPRNGVDRVIRACVAVRRMGTDARLILVGDGPLRPRYQAMVPGGPPRRRPLRGVRAEPTSGAATTLRGMCCSARRWAGPSASSCSRRWRPGVRWSRPIRPASATSCATAWKGIWSTWRPTRRRRQLARAREPAAGRRLRAATLRGGRAASGGRASIGGRSPGRCWRSMHGSAATRSNPRQRRRAHDRPWTRALLLLALCAGLRVVSLARPCLSDDEATYCVVAREMLHGRVLYRDVVDHKPPLIYLTYAATQALGGRESGMLLLHIVDHRRRLDHSPAARADRGAGDGATRRNETRAVLRGAALHRLHDHAARLRRAGGELRALHAAAAVGVGAVLSPRVRGGCGRFSSPARGSSSAWRVLYKYQAAIQLPLYALHLAAVHRRRPARLLAGWLAVGLGFAAPLATPACG